MTSAGRSLIAIIALIGGIALTAIGAFTHDGGSQAAGASIITGVLGFAFGDRNGEKRLAAALTVLSAEATPAVRQLVANAAPVEHIVTEALAPVEHAVADVAKAVDVAKAKSRRRTASPPTPKTTPSTNTAAPIVTPTEG